MADSAQRILFSTGIMALILLALFGNLLVCLAVYYSRALRARINFLIVSLAVSDIIIASTAMPIWMCFEITDFRNMTHESAVRIQKAWNFFDMVGGVASIAHLAAISCERLWSVCAPLKHRRYMTTQFTMGVICGVWAYAFTASLLATFYSVENWTSHFTLVVGFLVPLSLILTAYGFIAFVVNKSPRTVVSEQDGVRINLTILIIVVLFVVCWGPYFIVVYLTQNCSSCFFFVIENLWLRSVLKALHYANSCINPIVYGIANAQYKEAFKGVFNKLCACCFAGHALISVSNITSPNSVSNRRRLFQCKRPNSEAQKLCGETPEEKEASLPQVNSYLPGDYRTIPNAPYDQVTPEKPNGRHTDGSVTSYI